MYFSVAWTYRKTRKIDFCNSACTFASKILLADKLPAFRARVRKRMESLK